MSWNTLGIMQSQIWILLFTWKGPFYAQVISLAYHKLYVTFYHTSHGLRSIMTCLFDSTQYQGNLYSHDTRPYSKSYLSPYGNCHHKETSPIIGDQTQLPPKTKESHHPSMSTRIWTIISSYLSIWECRTKIESHIHSLLQSIH